MRNTLAMSELCSLMLHGQLTTQTFTKWVLHHYGDPGGESLAAWVVRHHQVPHPLDRLRQREIDQFLMRPEMIDSELMKALFELRNVFALNAKLATAEIMSLDRTCCRYAPASSSLLADTLTKLLCAES